MNASRLAYIAVVALAASAAASQAQAQVIAGHPALRGAPQVAATSIDPNRFIVGHPAGGQQRAGHANYAHPAVTISAQGTPALDTNHFLVQPPSPVRWADAPAEGMSVAALR
jgi:hypothetical protein